MTFEEELEALIVRHQGWLARRVDEIHECLDDRSGGEGQSRSDLSRAHELAHQIVGTSGSLGFAEVSAVAFDLDTVLKQMLSSDGEQAQLGAGETATEFEDACRLLDNLRSVMTEVNLETSTLYSELVG